MKPPGRKKATGTSTLRRLLFKNLIPFIDYSELELKNHSKLLHQEGEHYTCVYCGMEANNWDHFEAIVDESEPSGYISELSNLVPACGSCNQSRGNTNWETWMRLNFKDDNRLEYRIEILKNFVSQNKKFNFRKDHVDDDFQVQFQHYVKQCDDIITSYKLLIAEGRKLQSRIQSSAETSN